MIGIPLIVVLTARAWKRDFRRSYVVPPLIPLIFVFVLFVRANSAKPAYPVDIKKAVPPITASQEREIRSGIAEGRFTPEETEHFLNGFKDRRFELDVAQSSHTSGESFLWITQHGELDSRRAAAMNLATPGYVLRFLLQDANPDVMHLAQHSAAERLCDPDALRSVYKQRSDRTVPSNRPNYLATDPVLPQLMAENPCTPRDVLEMMSMDRPSISAPARAALAKKPLTDQAESRLQ